VANDPHEQDQTSTPIAVETAMSRATRSVSLVVHALNEEIEKRCDYRKVGQ
jgi:hypothetical protein